jgi:alpha-N-arabinofuranosidase
MNRRVLLKGLASGAIGTLAARWPILAADAEIELAPQQPGPAINPHIYGHFIEHLGGVIYDGIWVGRDSKIPNIDGIRKQFVDDMKRIGAPNLRWPGGCFADGYHWRDGIGTPAKRPRTYNFWESRMPAGFHATESNAFGFHEFMRLCRLVGAEPYVAANVGSGTPQEFHDWVAYCNAPLGTLSLADERAANGEKEPFGIRYWGVGNESWGCGGNMKPGEYATLYRKFITQFPAFAPRPFLVATGPRGHSRDGDLGWTTGYFEAMHREPPDGFALHFYTDFRNTKVIPEKSTTEEWYAVLREGLRTEAVIEQHWNAMGKLDPQHRTKLVIDEWGTWYTPGALVAPGYILSQTTTLRDALHAAISFDIFNRHAAKIEMANIAQTINCLHSLFLAHESKYARTPTYYVFEMYRGHMRAQVVPLQIRVEDLAVPMTEGTGKMAGLAGSASIRGKRLTVTLTNPSTHGPVATRIRFAGGAKATEARGLALTHNDMAAANTFQNPNEVKLSQLPVSVAGSSLSVVIPKQAVAAIEIELA